MRRFLVCFIFAMVVCVASIGTSFAEQGVWYPYELEKTDSYGDASDKISDAFPDQNVTWRTNYVQVDLKNYYMFDLPVDEVSIMDKGDYWFLFISTPMVRSDKDYKNMYLLYSGLVEKLGAPKEYKPTVKKATFDGVTESSVFESEDDFISALKLSSSDDQFIAKFNNCKLQIDAYGDGYVSAFLMFDNAGVSDEMADPEKNQNDDNKTGTDETGKSALSIMESYTIVMDGDSMADTLDDGEILLLDTSEYGSEWYYSVGDSNNAVEQADRSVHGSPNMLDVVGCRYPVRGDVIFVKRIVGMPGDMVELREGFLYINGGRVPEESEIDGIHEMYRTRYAVDGSTFGPYYVPKKGDKAVVQEDGSVLINGEAWNRKRACLVLDVDGKTLKVYTRNKDDSSKERDGNILAYGKMVEEVLSWDGKILTPNEFCKNYPELIGKELIVDEDYYFVMGDHRNNSRDSRSEDVGVLQHSQIIGHITKVILPVDRARDVQ